MLTGPTTYNPLAHAARRDILDIVAEGRGACLGASPRGNRGKQAERGVRVLSRVSMTPLLAQTLTGHGGFAQYLHRFKLASSPYCACADKTQDLLHVLEECPIFLKERAETEVVLTHHLTRFEIFLAVRSREKREKPEDPGPRNPESRRRSEERDSSFASRPDGHSNDVFHVLLGSPIGSPNIFWCHRVRTAGVLPGAESGNFLAARFADIRKNRKPRGREVPDPDVGERSATRHLECALELSINASSIALRALVPVGDREDRIKVVLRCTLTMSDFQILMMETEGKHRNSMMKQRILAVFGLVEIVLRCILTMNDFQGLMMQLEGSDDGAGSLEAPSSEPEIVPCRPGSIIRP
ncbi:hypothetical protein EVAR_52245_1 [Eumeta japonica]|uniref:Retrovirus-related Pol polyprotein from type-1 retrotransposable element R1 n=1 Tax=Eumeta variegata TaxID=151549 RepID=A0A4C1YTC7_EUMVA|nr:hypothetical protein EVAR_52245_1 [Eumeta japonica]